MKLMNPPVGVSSLRLEIEKIAGQRDQKTLNVVRVEELKECSSFLQTNELSVLVPKIETGA
jgi:hypothetical protein